MKKLLLIIPAILLSTLVNAQSYFNKPWDIATITGIGNDIYQMLNSQYLTPQINFNEKINTCDITIKKSDGDNVKVFFEQGFINGDADERIKAQPIIDGRYTIKGPFRDILEIYKKLYNAEVNADDLKKAGYATIITKTEIGFKFNVAFARTGEYWSLIVRKVL